MEDLGDRAALAEKDAEIARLQALAESLAGRAERPDVAAAVAEEREACAALAESAPEREPMDPYCCAVTARNIAVDIRARS